MLVAVGRAPLVQGLGLDEIGVPTDPRTGIATDDHMRTAIPTIFAAGDVAGRWQLAHTAFREGEIAAENAMGHDSALGNPAVPRPIYTDPEIAGVGLTEAQARERYGDTVAVGMCPWVANARAVMSGTTSGWVKSIHETTYGELLGLVIVGPHATDLIEVGVVGLDAESTVETIADGIAPHPTLAEAIKEAGLVALGRAIHLPPKEALMSSRRNALVMSLGWWYLRRLIRKRGTAAVAGFVAGEGLSFVRRPRKRHPLRWLFLLGLAGGAAAYWWWRQQDGGDDWGDWQPGDPVEPPSEHEPTPEPDLPEPVAT